MAFFGADQLNKVNLSALSAFNVIDPFSLDYSQKHYDELTDTELMVSRGSVLLFDVEVYKNYFLVSFKCPTTKKIISFEMDDEKQLDIPKLKWICENYCIVGFNSFSFDIPILVVAILGGTNADFKMFTNWIIYDNIHRKELQEHIKSQFNLPDDWKIPVWNHIDLIEVAPLSASLKLYSGRINAQRMQELDIDPEKELTPKEKQVVRHYNINDLDNTGLLMTELTPALELRTKMSVEYQQDLRSRSDAQIAEAVIGTELKKLNGYWPKRANVSVGAILKYETPQWMKFQTPQLQELLKLVQDTNFFVSDTGGPQAPENFKPSVSIGSSTYKIGIGGLHSTESCIKHVTDDEIIYIDKDVASYYPAIILNLGLFPQHLGRNFLKVYRGIVNRRLEAKRTGNKIVNQSLKITINGTFGKLGSRWSILYAPDRIIQVLMTGQLGLLMLIETLELCGVSVVSGNTDGVLIKCPRAMYERMVSAVVYWERVTGFETEETKYKAVYQRDVNNFIAIKEDGGVKAKGAYAEKGSSGDSLLAKNPECNIVKDSVIEFLTKGTAIKDSVLACKDIRRFVTVRTVKGGGEKSGVYLGKAVRWYYSTAIQGTINYRLTGNKVPNSDNAMPLMDLPTEFPQDVDFERYIKLADETLKEIGYYNKANHSTGYLF